MKDRDIEVIKGLADNGMNVSQTAKALFMSKRTVWRSIVIIHKLTELNPRKFWDLVVLLKMIGEIV